MHDKKCTVCNIKIEEDKHEKREIYLKTVKFLMEKNNKNRFSGYDNITLIQNKQQKLIITKRSTILMFQHMKTTPTLLSAQETSETLNTCSKYLKK